MDRAQPHPSDIARFRDCLEASVPQALAEHAQRQALRFSEFRANHPTAGSGLTAASALKGLDGICPEAWQLAAQLSQIAPAELDQVSRARAVPPPARQVRKRTAQGLSDLLAQRGAVPVRPASPRRPGF